MIRIFYNCSYALHSLLVGQDFVVNVGDVLYFTGLVEEFGAFCDEHGLELVTNEVDTDVTADPEAYNQGKNSDSYSFACITEQKTELAPIGEDDEENDSNIQEYCLGQTSESLSHCDDETRLRFINKITDMIRGTFQEEGGIATELDSPVILSRKGRSRKRAAPSLTSILGEKVPTQIIIVKDTKMKRGDKPMVLIAINCHDRPGLLLDISKGLLRLSLQLHHSEAAVIGTRSLSVWRCEELLKSIELEEIWSILIVSYI